MFELFSYNSNHSLSQQQQQKSSCKSRAPAGDRTRDPRHRLKTQKAIFRKRGPLFRPEVINQFCSFLIPNIGRQLSVLSVILKKIEAKLRPCECRIQKHKE